MKRMKNLAQWIATALLVVVIIFQSIIMRRLEVLKPAAPSSNGEEVRIPSLKEIDESVRRWTMHHGQHFSAASQISALDTKIDGRLEKIEKRLDELTQSRQ
jgi:hypothetical protein